MNSRYVHLHDALGLGVMWLNREAVLHHTPAAAPTVQKVAPAPLPNAPSAPKARPKNAADRAAIPARLAALQRVGVYLADPAPAEAEPAPPPAPPEAAALTAPVRPARIAALCECPSPADIAAGTLFGGADGELLDKMFAAIGLRREDVYVGCWLNRLPDFNPEPSAEAVSAALPRLQGELAAAQPAALLLMGRFFEREDVRRHCAVFGLPEFRIPHPQQMLANPTLKRPAWHTLQALQTLLQESPP
ncbi:uracil-DNA glycosylase family protein [Conchiformibius kuhniae]|uniref:Uracil-DNA glycosylase family protein n=1 Tax=Conchiformibius kuhniae TaxID=211502 RepID=A0A8T9MYL2_9NEIS|nr:uracil-DNA glycosylase family protein [Conchiformibius kuhniae]UOP05578.1 uracil-DNA glycosylase [Conchiformibius kuhniae]